ncbi:MAG: hypothetical protein ACQEQX_07420, partial [Thermodesulfobacteriota bacterium]
ALPVPWGWFYFFLLLTFILHLLAMNIMLGSGLIALANHLRTSAPDQSLSKDISVQLPFAIAFTVNLGVAPLLFLQVLYGQFMYTSSVLMAVYWLSVVGLVIVAYVCAYVYDFKFQDLGRARSLFLALAVACLLLTGFFFTNNMTMMLSPERWSGYFQERSGTMLNLSDPTLFPRYLHFVLASIAVAGLYQAIIWKHRQGKSIPGALQNSRHGLKWFSYATVLQVLVGVWFLISLPKDIMLLFMGDSLLYTSSLFVVLTLAILLLYSAWKEKLWITAGLLLAMVTFMAWVRDLVRSAYLEPYYDISLREVVPQYSPLLVFLLVLLLGLGTVAYMLRLALGSLKES